MLEISEKNANVVAEKVNASQLIACDLSGRLIVYLLRGWFLNCLSPAFADA